LVDEKKGKMYLKKKKRASFRTFITFRFKIFVVDFMVLENCEFFYFNFDLSFTYSVSTTVP
jgi:hypothetical protein